MYKVIQTKSLNKCFRVLARHGKKGKDAITKVRAALAEAGTEGNISGLKRTNHGESRLQNVEKYDLGDGYRLVVQLVDGKENVRAFLFAGDHEDCEEWLESHKDYTWVKNNEDHTLEFIQVSEREPRSVRIVNPEIDTAEELRSLPLLRHLDESEWESLALNRGTKEYLLSITPEEWECDPSGILEHIESISTLEAAVLFDDLFSHAHKSEISELKKRISYELGEASISEGADLTRDISEPINSEIFVTWEEVSTLPEDSSWADWLLFLHPAQKELSIKEFNGTARLRGVSGSGKTCVMLHRARYLAKKYREPILLLTLTESMRKLLDSLIKELCGVESSFIKTSTINSLAHSIIRDLHPKGEGAYRTINQTLSNDIQTETVDYIKGHDLFKRIAQSKLDYIGLKRFVDEEIFYLRSRLIYSNFEDYLDSSKFKRYGRPSRLSVEARRVFLDATKHKVDALKNMFVLDYEGVVSAALSLLKSDTISMSSFGWAEVDIDVLSNNLKYYSPYRCVLVDEVQDLSQLEVAMIGALPSDKENNISQISNGLFLVGDGAQTIYNKGFSLKSCNINVHNRSYVLKKNYRNSKEIMAASYSLIERYEFADVDEDNINNPTKPDMALKTGEKPYIVKCRTMDDEVHFVRAMIESAVNEYQSIEETDDYPKICVIALNSFARNRVQEELQSYSINAIELKQSSGIEAANSVAISTIESAKGYEFQTVFIVGVVEGAMPNRYLGEDDISREAARLYVAMTRAEQKLMISYNNENQNEPSRFLADIQSGCNEYEWKANRLYLIE